MKTGHPVLFPCEENCLWLQQNAYLANSFVLRLLLASAWLGSTCRRLFCSCLPLSLHTQK